MLVDDFVSQQQQSNAIPSENKDPQLNFTTVNGVQYISVVDERNRRGRPPKAKKEDAQDEPMAPTLPDDQHLEELPQEQVEPGEQLNEAPARQSQDEEAKQEPHVDSQQAVQEVQQPAEHPATAIEEAPEEQPDAVPVQDELLAPQVVKSDD